MLFVLSTNIIFIKMYKTYSLDVYYVAVVVIVIGSSFVQFFVVVVVVPMKTMMMVDGMLEIGRARCIHI